MVANGKTSENKKPQRVKTSAIPIPASGDPNRFWPEGLTPFAFQLEAVAFALANKATYLALEPGLGKTVVARLIVNKLNQTKTYDVYYVCPPFLTSNTEAEFLKWQTNTNSNLFLYPDSMLGKVDFKPSKRPKILFVDEAHRFKNEQANRTKFLFELAKNFDRLVFLSGTPMPNSRPVELWPILKRFAPAYFGTNFFAYAKRFCGAYKDDFGWRFDGFTNRAEFKKRLTKSFMLRLKKSDVLDLPEKIEGLLTIGEGIPPIVSNLEKKVLAHYSPEDLVQGKIADSLGKGALHLSEYLKHLGDYKLKYVTPYVEKLLQDTKENIIIFTYHRAVLQGLSDFLVQHRPLVIDGSTPKEKRQAIVDEYQKNPERRVFIGNIMACGVGFTLTKASRVLFVEFSWRDGDNVQAADRAHRIGQDKSILVQYVVLKDSFDRKRMEVLLNKRRLAV